MVPSDEIRILDLLARRDAEYLVVKECEDKIAALLNGAAWPYPPPATPLPSAGHTSPRGKKWSFPGSALPQSRRRAQEKKASAVMVAASPLRELHPPQENAYRISFLDKGEAKVSFHTSVNAIRQMLELECESFRIERIETVDFQSMEDFRVLETLWERRG